MLKTCSSNVVKLSSSEAVLSSKGGELTIVVILLE